VYRSGGHYGDLGAGPAPDDAQWRRACKQADAAVDSPLEQRLQLVAQLLPSDDDDNDVDDVDMKPPKTPKTPKTPKVRGL